MTPDSTTGGAGAAETSYRATGSAMDSPSTLRVVADTAAEMAMESPARTCSADGLAEAKQQAWVLHPDHVYRKRWDMVQVVALLYVAILVPARTGFAIDLEPGSWTWWLELCVDVYFIGDIFVNCTPGTAMLFLAAKTVPSVLTPACCAPGSSHGVLRRWGPRDASESHRALIREAVVVGGRGVLPANSIHYADHSFDVREWRGVWTRQYHETLQNIAAAATRKAVAARATEEDYQAA